MLLDVWDPAREQQDLCAATLAALTTQQANNNLNHGVDSYQQFRLNANGTLFTTAAGPVKLAGGVEQFNSQLYAYVVGAENDGPNECEFRLYVV